MRLDGYKVENAYLNTSYDKSIASPGNVGSPRYDAPSYQPEQGDKKPVADAVKEPEQKTQRRNSSLDNIQITLGNRDNSLVGLGNIGGIQSGVMKKAVSTMQKDSVLHEYQYFVGNGALTTGKNTDVILSDEDGTVIRK
ncbi:hypothetical protein [Butyrivibrio sp. MB2005]|uniref:hypothetical protein n=1 Tax=Butyrivibrio sp. MB2005 TaxID=1280678 RepID=UPI00040A56BC|nr:hypothetical protein [Butyrivibrio sp. MB2005]